MSSAILPQLQILLGQLQDLDLQDLDPSLRSRLSNLTAATAATQAEIHHIESRTGSQNDCAETETVSEPPLRVPTALGRAPLHSSPSPCIPVTSDTISLSASVPPTGHTISEYSPASPFAPVASETVPPSASVSPTAHTASEHSPTTLPIHRFPWIEIEHEGVMPSESAFVKPGEPRQFGMPLTGILPLEPPLQLFQWPARTISNLGKPELHSLFPAPAAPPPELGCYPQAPVYSLNPEPDFSYRRGYRYAAPFYTSQRQIEHQRMLEVQIPPNLRPSHFDLDTQSFCSDPIPGMVQLPMGIPIVHHVNGDPKRTITAVCGHTLESLMQYEEGEKVQALIPRLMTLTWGIKETGTQPGVPGIFELPGMQKNLRSKHVDLGKLTPGDGSFNLASTHGEGEGHGIFMPAVQTNTPEAAAIIKEVLQILHQLYRLIMPLCISRFEWDMLEFNNIENNVVAFGGLEPGPTSCQLNSSSAANVVIHGIPDLTDTAASTTDPLKLSPKQSPPDAGLSHPAESAADGPLKLSPPEVSPDSGPSRPANPAESPTDTPSHPTDTPPEPPRTKPTGKSRQRRKIIELGEILLTLLEKSIGAQGNAHGDFKDDALAFTLFVLLFRLAPGSDLGPFLWMRGGIYLRALDAYILFTSFKAQDIHMGSAPTYVKKIQDAWISMDTANELFKRFGPQVRCGYVMYPSMAATARTTQILYSPSLHFLHSPAPNIRDSYRKYYCLHGGTILGNARARANRLGVEGVKGLKNYLIQCDLNLELDVNELLKRTTYVDEDGQIQRLEPSPLDIEDDQVYEMICIYRRYYFWLREVIAEYSLGLTKPKFKATQEAIRNAHSGFMQHQQVLPTEHSLLPKRRLQNKVPGTFPLIDRIVSRRQQGSEALWTLVIQGQTQVTELIERKTPWLNMGDNARKCLQYLFKYGTAPPAKLVQTAAADADEIECTVQPMLVDDPEAVPRASTDSERSGPMLVDKTQNSAAPADETEHTVWPMLVDDVEVVPLVSTDPDQSSCAVIDKADNSAAAADGTQPMLVDAVPLLPQAFADLTGPPIEPTIIDDDARSGSPVTGVSPSPLGSRAGSPIVRRPRLRRRKAPSFSDSESDSVSSKVDKQKQIPRKRKRAAGPSESESSAAAEGEFEVEKIVGSREQNGDRQWLVRWKNCDASQDMWCEEEQLRGAQDLVNEFNSEAGLPEARFPRSQSPCSSRLSSGPPSPSPESSDTEYGKPQPEKMTSRSKRYLRMINPEDIKRPIETKELNTRFLCDLLNTAHLTTECDDISLASGALQKPADFRLAAESPRVLAGRILDQIERNNELSTRMYFELPSAESMSTWGPGLANLTLKCIADFGLTIPDMVAQVHIHDLLSRAVQAQVCRSLIAIYQWILYLGPSLAEQLISIHKAEGEAVLAAKFPELAPIVNHVVVFVERHQQQQEKIKLAKAAEKAKAKAAKHGKPAPRGRKKRRRIGDTSAMPNDSAAASAQNLDAGPSSSGDPEPSLVIPEPEEESVDWSRMPGNLFGLLPANKTNIKLEPLGPTVKVKDREAVYTIATKYLCKIWEEHLILKSMLKVDKYLNPDERTPPTRDFKECVRDRCITRGAILQCIADAFGDGIFASHGMKSFLLRPSRMFTSDIVRDEHCARAIEKNELDTLKNLDAWLLGCVVEDPDLEVQCTRLGELVHRGLLSLKLGQSLTDEDYENPHQMSTSSRTLSKISNATGKGKQKRRMAVVDIRPTISTLLRNGPSFGIAAIIIREALSKRRGKDFTAATKIYRRMLEGQHPTTGTQGKRDPDQMDPIRADLQGLKLLRKVLPPNLLTTRTGMSSLLVFMGTGQGSMTSEFLLRMEGKPNKMHFQTPEACIEQFRAIELWNMNLDLPSRIPYENSAIYGQPNVWYTTHPTLREGDNFITLTMEEKFQPYFSESIQRSWEAFLGPLANQDPAVSDAPRKSWEDVLRWIVQCGLRGFGSGLGPLQFANNMVLCGIAESPSPGTMAQWIFANKDYGAFTGLQVLGFNLPEKASAAAVQAAFFCFYYWLEHHLTAADKEVLHFGTIFVEQLLCKIGRWKKRMLEMAKIDLVAVAREIFEGHRWVRGANLEDHTKFPIPSCADISMSVFRSIIEFKKETLDIDSGVDTDT